MGWKARSFYRVKNTVHHTVSLVWSEEVQSWLGVWGLANWRDCVSGQAEHLQGEKVIKVPVCSRGSKSSEVTCLGLHREFLSNLR